MEASVATTSGTAAPVAAPSGTDEQCPPWAMELRGQLDVLQQSTVLAQQEARAARDRLRDKARKGKAKAGDADAAALANAQQLTGPIVPMPAPHKKEKAMVITDAMKSEDAHHKIRMARADYRLFGVRQRNRLVKEAKE